MYKGNVTQFKEAVNISRSKIKRTFRILNMLAEPK